MENLLNRNVGDIVKDNFRTATVFKEFGIDFCCGGQVALADACKENNIEATQVVEQLKSITDRSIPAGWDFDRWKLGFLADYIINTHHTYVVENIPVILQFAAKVEQKHGDFHPELVDINNLFNEAAEELINHLHKEETILFPLIKTLEQSLDPNAAHLPKAAHGVGNPIRVMVMEHENVGNLFKEIQHLTNNYQVPEDACNSYRVLFGKLQEFEADLHQHIHLENNILFPKAVELEKQVSN